jgi:acetyl esterase
MFPDISDSMKWPGDLSTAWRDRMDRMRFDPNNINIFHDNFRKLTRQFDSDGPDMFRMRDFFVPARETEGESFPQVPVRLYEPHGLLEEIGPTLLYIHGGGFVTCDLDSHDGICRRLASGANMRVLSVDYRLAPQYPFPAANNDCETVLGWIQSEGARDRGIDGSRLMIGGDSAGGTLCAYTVQQNRNLFHAQILFYPLLQLVEHKPHAPGLQDMLGVGELALRFIDEHYVAGADCHDPRLSPLLTENLSGLPPTFVLTCGLDPLRFEGKAYADKLAASGVRVTTHYEKALPHGFLNFARAFPKAKRVPLDAADFARKHLPVSPLG